MLALTCGGYGGKSARRLALIEVALLAVGLAVLWLVAVRTGAGQRADFQALSLFFGLQRPRLVHPLTTFTGSVGLIPFTLAGAALFLLAVWRRGAGAAATVAVMLLGANLSTEVLKSTLPGRAVWLLGPNTSPTRSFPSGHATACMSLVLCVLVAVGPRWRRRAVMAGAAYATALGCALLVLAAHDPSDVVGGYGMAWLWALLALNGISHGCLRRGRLSDGQQDDRSPARENMGSPWVPPAALLLAATVLGAVALGGDIRLLAAVAIVAGASVLPVCSTGRLISVSDNPGAHMLARRGSLPRASHLK